MRNLLSQYETATLASEWQFHSNSRGRPEVFLHDRLHRNQFSLSHSSGHALIAISQIPFFGADIELFSAKHASVDLQDVAGEHFTPSELSDLARSTSAKYERRFFEYWTAKEAIAKATGHGLASFSRFSVRLPHTHQLDSVSTIEVSFDSAPSIQRWHFRSLPLGDTGVGAMVALDTNDKGCSFVDKGIYGSLGGL